MPCILKYPGEYSPGIIVFTSNEYFFGVIGKDGKILKAIKHCHENGRWIYGVHINGNFHGTELEFEPPISFVLCADSTLDFLDKCHVPVVELTAEFFVELDSLALSQPCQPKWDLVIISRISKAKRFDLAIDLLEELFVRRPEIRVCIVAQSNERNVAERRYVLGMSKRIRALLLHDLTLFISRGELFGPFPITKLAIQDILANSSLLLVSSAREGGPRVLAEAAAIGTPCAVFEDLKSNLQKYFPSLGTVVISKNLSTAARQIIYFFDNKKNRLPMSSLFLNDINLDKIKNHLTAFLKLNCDVIDGMWDLSNLSARLPGHSRWGDQQIVYSRKLLLKWFDAVNRETNNFDADKFFLDNINLYKEPFWSQFKYGFIRFLKIIKSKLISLFRFI